jgi:hypothetical protein
MSDETKEATKTTPMVPILNYPDTDGARYTVEEWAAAEGHFPQQTTPPAPKHEPKRVMRPVHNPKFQLFAVAKHLLGWPEGKEMTRDQYVAAVRDANDPKKNTFR